MKRIRLRVIILVIWLFSFFLLSRLLDPIPLSDTAIALVLVMAILTLILPRLIDVRLWALLLIPIVALFVIKINTGELSGDLKIFLAVVEVGAIAITTALAYWVSAALREFEKNVARITLGQRENSPVLAPTGNGLIYREVRRARNHQRPLAVISIGVNEKSIETDVEKMVQEIQVSMIKQYKLQILSKVLCDQLEDCAVIVRDADRFIAALPETMPEELPVVVERLRQKVSEQGGVEIKIGMAMLPQDGYTFDGLVDKATRAMELGQEPQAYIALEHYPVEHPII